MDIGVVYNFTGNPGDGDLVALNSIETLVENGYSVYLYTSMPKGIWRAIWYFNKDSEIFRNVAIKRVEIPGIKHPFSI